MTTLDAFCKALGWQGGTIHQARERFAVASMAEMNAVCSVLLKYAGTVTDPRTILYFLGKREHAARLHRRAKTD